MAIVKAAGLALRATPETYAECNGSLPTGTLCVILERHGRYAKVKAGCDGSPADWVQLSRAARTGRSAGAEGGGGGAAAAAAAARGEVARAGAGSRFTAPGRRAPLTTTFTVNLMPDRPPPLDPRLLGDRMQRASTTVGGRGRGRGRGRAQVAQGRGRGSRLVGGASWKQQHSVSPKLKLDQRVGSGVRRVSSASRGSPSDNMLLSVRSWRTTGQDDGEGGDAEDQKLEG